MKICISGFTASGKTTIAEMLSRQLNIMHIHKSYKEYIKTEKEVTKFTEEASAEFVKAFDKEIAELAAKEENCVLSTWLSPWFIKDATVRIWLDASIDERARRWSKEYKTGVREARDFIKGKDESEIRSIKRIYGIDLNDKSMFDMCINTEKVGLSEAVNLISVLSLERSKKGF